MGRETCSSEESWDWLNSTTNPRNLRYESKFYAALKQYKTLLECPTLPLPLCNSHRSIPHLQLCWFIAEIGHSVPHVQSEAQHDDRARAKMHMSFHHGLCEIALPKHSIQILCLFLRKRLQKSPLSVTNCLIQAWLEP